MHWTVLAAHPMLIALVAIALVLGLIAVAWRFGMDNVIKYSLPVLTVNSMVFCGFMLAFSPDKGDIVVIGMATVIAIGIAVLVIFVGVAANWTTALLWGISCFACGAVLGLVFGIPPLAQNKPSDTSQAPKSTSAAPAAATTTSTSTTPTTPAAPTTATATPPAVTTTNTPTTAANKTNQKDASANGPSYGVNTNLTDISDWLTKIIVGVGLVQLGKIRGLLRDASRFVSVGLASGVQGKTPEDFATMSLSILLYFSAIGFLSSYLLTRTWLPDVLLKASN